MVTSSKNDIMDKLSIHNILRLKSLSSELDYERACSIFLKLRVFIKDDESYMPIRNHLRTLIKKYEQHNWIDEDHITDKQIKDSDLAESLVYLENEFYQKRKELIKEKIKSVGLNQSDLAKVLGHRKGYMSELINGLRPLSKDDIIVINRLFKIKYEDLIPPYIHQDRALHIKNTLDSFSHSKIKLTKLDFGLQLA